MKNKAMLIEISKLALDDHWIVLSDSIQSLTPKIVNIRPKQSPMDVWTLIKADLCDMDPKLYGLRLDVFTNGNGQQLLQWEVGLIKTKK